MLEASEGVETPAVWHKTAFYSASTLQGEGHAYHHSTLPSTQHTQRKPEKGPHGASHTHSLSVPHKVHAMPSVRRLQRRLHAVPPEVRRGFQLPALCGELGLESDHLSGAVLTAAAADGTAAVDGAEAAEEFCGRLSSAALQVGQGASPPGTQTGTCLLNGAAAVASGKEDSYRCVLPGPLLIH